MSGMATGGAAAPAAPPKITLDQNRIYTLVLTGYSTPGGVNTNGRWGETNRRWEWFDNATGQWSVVPTAAPLALNTAFHCKLGSESQSYVYEGALRNNRLVVRRLDAQGTPYAMEALHIVVKKVEANTIYAVLLWQCFGEVILVTKKGKTKDEPPTVQFEMTNPEELYPPSQFDSVMTVPANEVDRSIDAWHRERRRIHKLHKRTKRKESQCRIGSVWDVILLQATAFHRTQRPEVDARTLPMLQPNMAYGPVAVLQTFTQEGDNAHFYVWLKLQIGNVECALCVQVDANHPNLGRVNDQTGRKALVGNLIWFTYYAVYAQGGHLPQHLPQGVSLTPSRPHQVHQLHPFDTLNALHDNTPRLRF